MWRGAFLVDGDGRGEPLDVVHIRFLHLAQELAGVGGERFHVAPLAFGKDGVESQGGFPGTGKPGDDHQLVARDLHGDILQVVFACADHADDIGRHAGLS